MKIRFRTIVGKHILIGITLLDNDRNENCKVQMHGVIEYANRKKGIGVRLEGKTVPPPLKLDDQGLFCLPPELSAIEVASKGVYKLKTTGEEVIDPDLLTTWTFTQSE